MEVHQIQEEMEEYQTLAILLVTSPFLLSPMAKGGAPLSLCHPQPQCNLGSEVCYHEVGAAAV